MLRLRNTRAGRALAGLKRSESGATAVEFAIVAAPFFYVLGCICETGLMLFTEYVIQNSVQEASRMVRTGQVTSSDGSELLSAADFKDAICESVNVIINCDSDLNVYVASATDFATLTADMENPIDIGRKTNGDPYVPVYSPGGALKAATVIATYDWNFSFPFMEFLGNVNGGGARRIYGLAIFRNEPFGS
jgi:Flp pilus assembly protein TadG